MSAPRREPKGAVMRRGLAHLPEEFVQTWGEPQLRAALDVLISVGYGSPKGTKARRAVHHRVRLGDIRVWIELITGAHRPYLLIRRVHPIDFPRPSACTTRT
jgi:hypothetical protein